MFENGRKNTTSAGEICMISNQSRKPLIGLPADTFHNSGLLYHSAGDKYAYAIRTAAGGVPVLLPSTGTSANSDDLRDIITLLDGILLTGAPSNVHPRHYDRPDRNAEPYDETRDETTLPLIAMAVAEALPLFAICRGMQELNVALGGSLHHDIHKQPGKLDHLGDVESEVHIRYGPRHQAEIAEHGKVADVLKPGEITINSVHRQAIDRLAERLDIEARAPDGVIEAVTVKDVESFALGVQWHPEYDVRQNSDSRKLFAAFGRAAADRRAQR